MTILCLWQADIGERCNIKLYVLAICWVGEVHNLEETLPLLLSHPSLHLWLSRRRKEVWRHDARVLHLTLTSVTLGSGKYTWISKSLSDQFVTGLVKTPHTPGGAKVAACNVKVGVSETEWGSTCSLYFAGEKIQHAVKICKRKNERGMVAYQVLCKPRYAGFP